MKRIEERLLDWENDLLTFKGKPYTGETFHAYDNGNIKREMTYEGGLPSGWCKEWYESGKIKKEWLAVRSQGASEERQYYESGSLLSVRSAEYNVETSYEKYSDSGKILEQRKLDPNSPMAKFLERMRRIHA